jgi:protein involved in polysaccharide export with SLBB domain
MLHFSHYNVRFAMCVAPMVLATVGCAPNNKDMLHFLRDREHQVSAIEYRLGIPDSIAIVAPHIAEIDGDVHPIQPNGKITLKLLGDVKIVGMTAKEVAAKLEVLLGRYYVDPKVSVQVAAYKSKKFYVYGEGVGAQPKRYTGRDTLLDAVFAAVPNFLSWTSRVRVIRPARDDRPVRQIVVDVKEMIRTGDWSKNILLEPDDVVFVPPTPTAWIAHRIHEILYPVTPLAALYTGPAYVRDAGDVYDDDRRSTTSFSTNGSGTSGGF